MIVENIFCAISTTKSYTHEGEDEFIHFLLHIFSSLIPRAMLCKMNKNEYYSRPLTKFAKHAIIDSEAHTKISKGAHVDEKNSTVFIGIRHVAVTHCL